MKRKRDSFASWDAGHDEFYNTSQHLPSEQRESQRLRPLPEVLTSFVYEPDSASAPPIKKPSIHSEAPQPIVPDSIPNSSHSQTDDALLLLGSQSSLEAALIAECDRVEQSIGLSTSSSTNLTAVNALLLPMNTFDAAVDVPSASDRWETADVHEMDKAVQSDVYLLSIVLPVHGEEAPLEPILLSSESPPIPVANHQLIVSLDRMKMDEKEEKVHCQFPTTYTSFSTPVSSSSSSSSSSMPSGSTGSSYFSSGFRKANGNAVTVSDEARARARQILGDCDAVSVEQPLAHHQSAVEPSVSNPSPDAGRRSGHKGDSEPVHNVPVESRFSTPMHMYMPPPESSSSSLSGFRKANGGAVTISAAARARAQQILAQPAPQSVYNPGEVPRVAVTPSLQSAPTTPSTGFRKANGSSVTISAEARARAERILGSSSTSSVPHTSSTAASVQTVTAQPPVIVQDTTLGTTSTTLSSSGSSSGTGFRKANGGAVSISAEARLRALQILNGGPSSATTTPSSSSSTEAIAAPMHTVTPATRSSSSTTLFQKANGGAVTISEAARARAAALLLNPPDPITAAPSASSRLLDREEPPTRSTTSSSSGSTGFRKANGCAVTISEEARARARQLLATPIAASATRTTTTTAPLPAVTPLASLQSAPAALFQPSMSAHNNRGHTTVITPSEDVDTDMDVDPVDDSIPTIYASSHNTPQRFVVTPITPTSTSTTSTSFSEAQSRVWSALLSLSSSLPSETAQHIYHAYTQLTASTCRCYLLEEEIDVRELMMVEDEEEVADQQRLRSLHSVTSQTALDPSLLSALLLSSSSHNNSHSDSNHWTLNDLFYQLQITPKDHWKQQQLVWILWTLACHERRDPYLYLHRLLTLETLSDCLQQREKQFKSGRKGKHVSQLQRYEEIVQWELPLCLCLSVHQSEHSEDKTKTPIKGRSPTPSAVVQQRYRVQVTDGWWWTTVALDAPLQTLVQQGKLTDGTKIIVFTARFQPSDDSSSSKTNSHSSGSSSGSVLHLQYNAVRRACSSLRLGRLPKQSLLRGISVASILPEGGPIFALRCRILSKIRHVALSNSTRSSSPLSKLYMTEKEAEYLLETLQEQLVARNEERQQQNWRMEEEEEETDVSSALNIAEQISIQTVTALLVQCQVSHHLCWVILTEGGGGMSDETASLSWELHSKEYVLTHLQPSRRSKWSNGGQGSAQKQQRPVQVLFSTRASSVETVSSTTGTSDHSQGKNRLQPQQPSETVKAQVKVVTSTDCMHYPALPLSVPLSLPQSQSLSQSREKYLSSFISFTATLLDYRIEPLSSPPSTTSSHQVVMDIDRDISTDNPLSLSAVTLSLSDGHRWSFTLTLMLSTYQIPTPTSRSSSSGQLSKKKGKVSWLYIGAAVHIEYAQIHQIDSSLGIIFLERGEMTTINHIPPTSTADASTSSVLWSVWCQDERARLCALRDNALHYSSVLLSSQATALPSTTWLQCTLHPISLVTVLSLTLVNSAPSDGVSLYRVQIAVSEEVYRAELSDSLRSHCTFRRVHSMTSMEAVWTLEVLWVVVSEEVQTQAKEVLSRVNMRMSEVQEGTTTVCAAMSLQLLTQQPTDVTDTNAGEERAAVRCLLRCVQWL